MKFWDIRDRRARTYDCKRVSSDSPWSSQADIFALDYLIDENSVEGWERNPKCWIFKYQNMQPLLRGMTLLWRGWSGNKTGVQALMSIWRIILLSTCISKKGIHVHLVFRVFSIAVRPESFQLRTRASTLSLFAKWLGVTAAEMPQILASP